VSIHQAEADIFGAYSSRARETISEGEVYPCMKMGGNLLTFQQASMPSNELVRRRSPGNKFKIREVRVDGGKYRRVGVKLWDCFIWAPLIKSHHGARILGGDPRWPDCPLKNCTRGSAAEVGVVRDFRQDVGNMVRCNHSSSSSLISTFESLITFCETELGFGKVPD